MQGFIIKITKSIKEDLFVRILTHKHYYELYRFYGTRHNILYTGRKIDFEIEYNGIHIPKLRNIMHIAREYELQLNKVYVWQQFCILLDKHLHETKDIESFYFELMDKYSYIINKQNAKRAICSMYVHLLEFEGRLYHNNKCFICGETLLDTIAITRGFLFACPSCVVSPTIIDKKIMINFFETKSSINLDDLICNTLYDVVLQGL